VEKRHPKQKRKSILEQLREDRTTDSMWDSIYRQTEAHFAAGAFAVEIVLPYEVVDSRCALDARRSKQVEQN
jgi:hypothetical protein